MVGVGKQNLLRALGLKFDQLINKTTPNTSIIRSKCKEKGGMDSLMLIGSKKKSFECFFEF